MINLDKIIGSLKEISSFDEGKLFIHKLLKSFEFPDATIDRLKYVKSQVSDSNEITIKNKILLIDSNSDNLHQYFEIVKGYRLSTTKERFILVFNRDFLLSYDTDTEETLYVKKKDLHEYASFFLPLLGIEKTKYNETKTLDVKAAEKFAELYNELVIINNYQKSNERECLNIVLARILFCFCADNIGLFQVGSIGNILQAYSHESGKDLNTVLESIFLSIAETSSTKSNQVYGLSNLGLSLFKEKIPIPNFDRKTRNLLIYLSSLSWRDINADIWGSLIQSIVIPSDVNLGNHFTSTTNIMKVLGPLFLNELYEKFEKNRSNVLELLSLLNRVASIKLFDPYTGSGSFLIVALKELKFLELKIKEQIYLLQDDIKCTQKVSLNQFYGIGNDRFVTMIAQIGLWLTYNQFSELPFSHEAEYDLAFFETNNLVAGNATRIKWDSICKNTGEVYLICSPRYIGSRKQTSEQKNDILHVFKGYKNINNLDYSACWIFLASCYIKNTSAKAGLVTTNSICQGEQVGLLWPKIFEKNVHIFFAYSSFKWKNNARNKSGVTVIIIGLQDNRIISTKNIFSHLTNYEVQSINPYLTSSGDIIVNSRRTPISSILPPMPKGNMPYDNGNLILSNQEKEMLIQEYPESIKYIKKLVGSDEFINGIDRWCLWISDDEIASASKIKPISERVEKVKHFRLSSKDAGAHRLAEKAHQFREFRQTKKQSIIIPSVSSEKRPYIPIGFVNKDTIITNLAFALYDCDPWIFGLLTSKMHLAWIKTVCGCLETRIRYSAVLGYNTFPFPNISESRKQSILKLVYNIISEREEQSEKSLAEIYDINKMSQNLKNAHDLLDREIDKCYRSTPFYSDQERLEFLFTEYSHLESNKYGSEYC